MIKEPKENEYTEEDVTQEYFNQFSSDKKKLEYFGLREWEKDVMLLPLYLFDNIPDGTVMVSINGERKVKGKDKIDDDTRAGLMAYGFTKSQHKDVAELFINLKINNKIIYGK